MTTSVSSYTPSNYLTQLLGNKPFTAVANVASVKPVATGTTTGTSNTSSTSAASTNSAAASSTSTATSPSDLLGLSSSVLSLLQETSPSDSNVQLADTLYNSSSTTDPLTSTLLAQDTSDLPTQEAVQDTQAQQAEASANNSPVQSLLNSYNTTQNNNTASLIQGAQSLLQSLSA